MRSGAYGLFALLAWPALVWCVVEAGLRVLSGYPSGSAPLLLTAGCAVGTIVATHMRRAALVAAKSRTPARG